MSLGPILVCILWQVLFKLFHTHLELALKPTKSLNLWISYLSLLKTGITKPVPQSQALRKLKEWNFFFFFGSWFQRALVVVFWCHALGLNSMAGSICDPSYSSLLEGQDAGKWYVGRGQSKICPSGPIPPVTYCLQLGLTSSLSQLPNNAILLWLYQGIDPFIRPRAAVWLVHISADQKEESLSWKWARLYI